MTGGKTDATALASVGRTGETLAVEVIMNDVGDRTDSDENQPFSGKAIRLSSASQTFTEPDNSPLGPCQSSNSNKQSLHHFLSPIHQNQQVTNVPQILKLESQVYHP